METIQRLTASDHSLQAFGFLIDILTDVFGQSGLLDTVILFHSPAGPTRKAPRPQHLSLCCREGGSHTFEEKG